MERMKLLVTTLIFFAVTFLIGPQARADFLGLGVGSYETILSGSGVLGLCGMSDCVGIVSITADPVSSTSDFSWNFVIAGITFDWSGADNRTVDYSPDNTETCAQEGGLSCDAGNETIGYGGSPLPFLALINFDSNPDTNSWYFASEATSQDCTGGDCIPCNLGSVCTGSWTATKIPEPSSVYLLLLGLTMLVKRLSKLA